MKRSFAAVVVAVGLLASGSASAGGALSARVGVNGGDYGFEYTYSDAGCGLPCGPYGTTVDSDTVYGGAVGLNLVAAAFFADLGVEYAKYKEADNYYRSDALLTLGAFLGDHFQIFGGYRRGTYGDGFFSSDIPTSSTGAVFAHTEYGPFLGGGVAFKLGKKASLGMTLAYNVLTYETPSGTQLTDVDYNGLSAKLQLGLPGNVQTYIRFQRFEADQTQAGSFAEDLTTDYFVLGVQKGFTFVSW